MFENELEITPEEEAERIKGFIKRELETLHKDGVIIGLSGGLNSSTIVFLANEALGKEKIFVLILPERDSDPENIKNARKVVKILDLPYREIDLSQILEKFGLYQLSVEKLPQNRNFLETFIKISKTPFLFSQGFFSFYTEFKISTMTKKFLSKYRNEILALVTLKTRLRMVFLYYYARLKNYLVLGTSDKTEWTIGYYDGDVIVDIQPLLHLYKTQIKKLAEFCGVPKEIIEKPSSGDIFGKGIANEIVIGMPYQTIDSILYYLEKGYSIERIADLLGVERKGIVAISNLITFEKIRKSIPLSLSQNV